MVGAQSLGDQVCDLTTLGGTKPQRLPVVKFQLSTHTFSGKPVEISFDSCLVVETISGVTHPLSARHASQVPKNLPLNYRIAHTDQKTVHVLIGQPVISKILQTLPVPNMPNLFLYKTLFGMVPAGSVTEEVETQRVLFSDPKQKVSTSKPLLPNDHKELSLLSATDHLHLLLKDYWSVECLPNDDEDITLEEVEAVRILKENLHYDTDKKKYVVGFPFKEEPILTPTKNSAFTRYMNLEKSLKQSPHCQAYVDYMDSLVDNETIRELTPDECQYYNSLPAGKGCPYYSPHFAVLNPKSKSTPVRPVFAYNEKCRRGFDATTGDIIEPKSLNSFLHAGPNLLPTLLSLHLRFRRHEICWIADVKKMFHSIDLPPDHLRYTLFFWKPGGPFSKNEVKTYCSLKHNFGQTSAPFVANYVMAHNARVEAEKTNSVIRKKACQLITSSVYVDDFLCSQPTVSMAAEMISEMVDICAQGSFKLAKFATNSQELLRLIPSELHANDPSEDHELALDESDAWYLSRSDERPLGLLFNTKQDIYKFGNLDLGHFDENTVLTRRLMTSIIAKCSYDVIGYRAPFLITARRIIQMSFERSNDPSHDWDKPLDSELVELFTEWFRYVKDLDDAFIPRFLPLDETAQFSDSSVIIMVDGGDAGYGSVAYLRYLNNQTGCYETRFIAARGKVRNRNVIKTVPRCELHGLLSGLQLFLTIRAAWDNLDVSRFVFFTDSACNLHWYHGAFMKLKPYSASRIGQVRIHKITLRWCPSATNAADLTTKINMTPGQLKEDLWKHGPEFLRQDTARWPEHTLQPVAELSNAEREAIASEFYKSTRVLAYQIEDQQDIILDVLHSSYKLQKTCRILALIQRFCIRASKTLPKSRFHHLSDQLYLLEQRSFYYFVNRTQKLYFADEIEDLEGGNEFANVSNKSTIRNFNPILVAENNPSSMAFCDGIPLLRFATRLISNDKLAYSRTHPVLLPTKSHLTSSLLLFVHEYYWHASAKYMVWHIKTFAHVIHLRDAAKNFVSKCLSCQKSNARRQCQQMAPLPPVRTDLSFPALSNLMVDAAGHILIKSHLSPRSSVVHKAYFLVFSCLSTRFTILTYVDSLTTSSFLAALQKVAGLYSPQIKNLYSDLGSNFVQAAKVNDEWREFLIREKSEIDSQLTAAQFNWQFSPPGASFRNGAVEKIVHLTKNSLRAVFKGKIMTDQELSVALAQIQGYLNSRPLCSFSDLDDEADVITPSSLLFGTTATHAEFDYSHSELLAPQARAQAIQRQATFEHFTRRFLTQYLDMLKSRQTWKDKKESLKVGDLVLIRDANRHTKQYKFPLGRITEAPLSHDNLHRTFKIQLRSPRQFVTDDKGRIKATYFAGEPSYTMKAAQQLHRLELALLPSDKAKEQSFLTTTLPCDPEMLAYYTQNRYIVRPAILTEKVMLVEYKRPKPHFKKSKPRKAPQARKKVHAEAKTMPVVGPIRVYDPSSTQYSPLKLPRFFKDKY